MENHHHADNANNGNSASPSITAIPISVIPTAPPPVHYAKPFPDISKIELFAGQNFRRWQERVYSALDMHGVVHALSDPRPAPDSDSKITEPWSYANKVCRHTILTTLSNELFDVYSSYKDAKDIWESMILKYTQKMQENKNSS